MAHHVSCSSRGTAEMFVLFEGGLKCGKAFGSDPSRRKVGICVTSSLGALDSGKTDIATAQFIHVFATSAFLVAPGPSLPHFPLTHRVCSLRYPHSRSLVDLRRSFLHCDYLGQHPQIECLHRMHMIYKGTPPAPLGGGQAPL